MGNSLSSADQARVIKMARQAEAAGKAANKSQIAATLSLDRGTIRSVISQWTAAGKPETWPTVKENLTVQAPANSAIVATPEPQSDIYAAFLEFAKLHGLPIQASVQAAAALEPIQPIERPKHPAIFTPKKFTKIAFISDVHLPFEDRPAVRVMLDFLADYSPDMVILGGDIFDFYEVSDFDKSPGRITTLQDEFDNGRYFIKAIDELAPEVHFLIGNHEDRLQRVINRNPGLFKLRSLEMQRAAELPDNWRVHPSQTHFRLGKLTGLHGDIKGVKSAVHPARVMFQKLKRSCLFGHYHRAGIHLDTNYDGEVRGGFANGHLSDVSRVTSWITCPDWQQSITTVSLCEDGGFAVQQRLFVNSRLITEGKEYTL